MNNTNLPDLAIELVAKRKGISKDDLSIASLVVNGRVQEFVLINKHIDLERFEVAFYMGNRVVIKTIKVTSVDVFDFKEKLDD